jgi:Dyp-type peroxidase family
MKEDDVGKTTSNNGIDPEMLIRKPGPVKQDPDLGTSEGQAYQQIFDDLQGNIIKGHDRDYACHIFLRFNCKDPKQLSQEQREKNDEIRNLIKERIAQSVLHLTSAARQFRETDLYRSNKIRGKVFVNFFLTYSGYVALGLGNEVDFEPSYKGGMKGAQPLLNDDPNVPYADDWQGYMDKEKYWPRDGEVDAMILIADDDVEYLRRTELRIVNNILMTEIGGHKISLAEVVTVQRGAQLRVTNEILPRMPRIDAQKFAGHPIEHFGHIDGISNPLFLTTDIKRVDEFMGQYHWSPWAPLNLVLLKDPHPASGRYGYGSYMVFRKLEQHVGLFNSFKADLARALKIAVTPDPSKPEFLIDKIDRTGALIMGRYNEGTPTVETPPLLKDSVDDRGNPVKEYDPDGHPYQVKITNDFTYDKPMDDLQAINCPFHAHIRSTNDRTVNTHANHRIVRRGITYGSRAADLSDAPDVGVGLLFVCFQRSIREGFEHIQRKANGMDPKNNNPAIVNDRVDPIIGQINAGDVPEGQPWPNQIGGNNSVKFRFTGVVSLKGGEYFFAPSISFLRNITQAKVTDLAKTFAEKGL